MLAVFSAHVYSFATLVKNLQLFVQLHYNYIGLLNNKKRNCFVLQEYAHSIHIRKVAKLQPCYANACEKDTGRCV